MKRPRLIKDRMAHRDTMLESLHADALDDVLKKEMPEKARKAIEDKALTAREKVQAMKAVKKR